MEHLNKLERQIEKIRLTKNELYLTGDFNLDSLKWNEQNYKWKSLYTKLQSTMKHNGIIHIE